MQQQARFQVYGNRHGQWFWRLKAANGKTIADGAEAYASASNARRAVRRTSEIVRGVLAPNGVYLDTLSRGGKVVATEKLP